MFDFKYSKCLLNYLFFFMKVYVYIEKEKLSGFIMFVLKIIIMFFDFFF